MKTETRSKKRNAIPKRSSCRACGHKELLTFGPDQFCTKCDWNTCLEYVEKGLMNNLNIAYQQHFPKKSVIKSVPPATTQNPEPNSISTPTKSKSLKETA